MKAALKLPGDSQAVDISAVQKGVYAFGPFRQDPLCRVLLRDEAVVDLSPKLFDMLLYLIEHPDRVVGKEELMSALWPGRIVEEGNISQIVYGLRKALGNQGDMGRCIATVPGHGYRFTAPVLTLPRRTSPLPPDAAAAPAAPIVAPPANAGSAGAPAPAQPLPRQFGRILHNALFIGALTALAACLLGAALPRRAAPPITERSSIVMADFINQTGDPDFDPVLGKVLKIDLEESPFLKLIPPHQVGATLQQMERPRDAKLTPELAREVCARNQGKAVLSGAIAAVGSRYLITLEASDCLSGRNLAQGKTEASSKEDVVQALDGLSEDMRQNLSESMASTREPELALASH